MIRNVDETPHVAFIVDAKRRLVAAETVKKRPNLRVKRTETRIVVARKEARSLTRVILWGNQSGVYINQLGADLTPPRLSEVSAPLTRTVSSVYHPRKSCEFAKIDTSRSIEELYPSLCKYLKTGELPKLRVRRATRCSETGSRTYRSFG